MIKDISSVITSICGINFKKTLILAKEALVSKHFKPEHKYRPILKLPRL
jgi:hypothetical protein